jgi:hypothetical protein
MFDDSGSEEDQDEKASPPGYILSPTVGATLKIMQF